MENLTTLFVLHPPQPKLSVPFRMAYEGNKCFYQTSNRRERGQKYIFLERHALSQTNTSSNHPFEPYLHYEKDMGNYVLKPASWSRLGVVAGSHREENSLDAVLNRIMESNVK